MKTHLATRQPWGLFVSRGTRLLCADGKIRAVSRIAETGDTFFSIPCSVKIKGKTVSGYATTEEQVWIHGKKETDFKRAYVFRQYTNQKNSGLLPLWPTATADDSGAEKINSLIESAQ